MLTAGDWPLGAGVMAHGYGQNTEGPDIVTGPKLPRDYGGPVRGVSGPTGWVEDFSGVGSFCIGLWPPRGF